MRLKNKIAYVGLLLATLLSLSRLGAATDRNVPLPYTSINAALDDAVTGDTVKVSEGEYSENIIIEKDGVTIQGAGAGRTFLNLTTLGGTAVTFNNVTGSALIGFTIRNADVGVRANRSKASVANNIFLANVNAFENNSSFPSIVNNTFYRNTRAVFTNSSSTLTNNIIAGSSRYGVVGSRAGSITYNLFHRNAIGNYSGISEPAATFKNITGNPLFVNYTSDFHLRELSPAIKRGDPSLKNSFNNTTSDIGAYGGPDADVRPATVTGVAAVSATNSVTISWNRNLAYNITGYNVYYGTESSSLTPYPVSGNSNSVQFTSSPIEFNKKYFFAVTAVPDNISAHESDKSSPVSGAIDTIPPAEPTNLRADIGDKRLFLSWSAVINDINGGEDTSGVKGYRVHYGTSSGTYPNTIDVGNVTSYELTGLTNNTTYFIVVVAYDNVAPTPNESDHSSEVSQTPEEIRGILGLKSTGGCFIATAAYGSYEEKHVKILREFRDRYLLTNIPGRAFVSFYYRTSPPIADFIKNSETLKAIVRVVLLPLIAFAWMLINHPIVTLTGGGLIMFFLIARLKTLSCESIQSGLRRNTATAMLQIFILSFFIVLFNSSISLGNERSGLSFGLSYGQLEPASDEWKEIYDDDRISTYRVFLGYRFHPTISAEIGAGYLTKDGKGKTVTGAETGVETTFQEAPVDLTLIYRLNYFDEQLIVPYIGGGVSYNFYWENVKDGKELNGGMWGYHATGGLQILLDYIDRRSSIDLEQEYEIENTYLTIGATHSVIDDFGDEEVDLGGWNYNAGLLFEF